ncbi:MAG: alkaline phosphatase family protein, partial [Burkholderiales bacterium]|nr:alkaline phosphatase family protein [Anaerolineae bacterium]
MPIRQRLISALCAMVALICIAPNISTVSAQTTFVLSRVIVISLDGARPDAILQANTPNMHMLAERGTASWTAQTVYPSVTNIGHASMLTGLSVEQHGVNHNDSFVFPCPSLPIETPTFLTLAQQAAYSTAIVVGKERLCYFRQLEETDYTFAREGDRSVVDRVLEL